VDMIESTGWPKDIEAYLKSHFSALDRSTPQEETALHEFLRLGPLHSFIPTAMGGTCEGPGTYLPVVEMAAYYSLPLGLTLGITGSLFLMPILKHAPVALRDTLVADFLSGPALGGIMITEPTGGTDVFGLQSTVSPSPGGMLLNGTKCWGGLTGRAAHWLVAARKKRGDRLTRSLKLLYVPLASPGVSVDHYFDALGLQPITYGQTSFSDVTVPEAYDLTPPGTSALRVLYDTLFRSRLGISAIASGLCKRIVHECTKRAGERIVFGQPIAGLDQVQFRLATLRGQAQMNHALWHFAGDWMGSHDDLSGDYVLVNAIKVCSSESMTTAADSAVQLFASAAFKRSHMAGRAYVDSRPFRIFEGVNDVLHDNTFVVLAGRYGTVTADAVSRELATFGLRMPEGLPEGTLAALASPPDASQREHVHCGKVIEWVVVLAVMEYMNAQHAMPIDEARLVAQRSIAALIAERDYLL